VEMKKKYILISMFLLIIWCLFIFKLILGIQGITTKDIFQGIFSFLKVIPITIFSIFIAVYAFIKSRESLLVEKRGILLKGVFELQSSINQRNMKKEVILAKIKHLHDFFERIQITDSYRYHNDDLSSKEKEDAGLSSKEKDDITKIRESLINHQIYLDNFEKNHKNYGKYRTDISLITKNAKEYCFQEIEFFQFNTKTKKLLQSVEKGLLELYRLIAKERLYEFEIMIVEKDIELIYDRGKFYADVLNYNVNYRKKIYK